MIKPIKIKDVEIKNNIFLAPMAGYTDVGFRTLCSRMGAGLTFTEMVSAKALAMGSKKTEELLASLPEARPVAVQLFGSEPDAFIKAIKSGVLDKFDIIDINMGCPAPKIVGNKEGSYLMTQIPLAKKIIEACVGATTKPVSVKFRSGYTEDQIVAVEFAKMCEQAGASLITIHPRTKTQGYSGRADWDLVKDVVAAVSIPVIVSGDVKSREDMDYLTEVCGASGVMVGRASLGNPEIFDEILSASKRERTFSEKLEQIETHIEILTEFYPPRYIYMTMKKHILNYLKEFPGAATLKKEVSLCESLEQMLSLIRGQLK